MERHDYWKNKIYFVLLVFILIMSLSFNRLFSQQEKPQIDNLIQLAILLDTSNSMDGLIDQAKSQLWKIVNELALAKKDGESPDLEVSLYEYGKSSLDQGEGYLRMILPLTKDLDGVSEELFKLTTNGGDEYCGTVIKAAAEGLKWSKHNDVLKVIYIAGNEPFTQGNVDYRNSCKNSISKGIIVNTIFCGNHQEGINTNWKNGADLADGKYMSINQDQQIVQIDAPQDDEIIKLSQELNNTYIGYGLEGAKKKERQAAQDMNAIGMSAGSMVQRSVAKSSKQYNNASWDLVDAVSEEEVDLDELEDAQLPQELKGKSKEEISKYIYEMKDKRIQIQKKITKLNQDRNKYIAEKKKENAGEQTLDEAIINSIREQAKTRKFEF